jgi:hypothetical protein
MQNVGHLRRFGTSLVKTERSPNEHENVGNNHDHHWSVYIGD